MRVLLVAYCFIREDGQSMIGAYKRCMRVAMALINRGHEVALIHGGGEKYADELTQTVRRRVTTVNLLSFPANGGEMGLDETGRTRSTILEQLVAVKPDLVVLGENPLSGVFLETALCTAELGIPLVMLENAYGSLIQRLCIDIGPIADGLVLTGPSSFYTPQPPAHLCQVPPFIETVPVSERGTATKALNLTGDKLITVLAYDAKVEKVAVNLATQLEGSDCEMVLLSRRPEALQRRLATLDCAITTKAIPLPSEPVLFDLLRMSRLAIVKYGFMQVTEAISLRTPVLAVYYGGPRWLQYAPKDCHKFIYVTTDDDTGSEIAAAARKLMDTAKEEMAEIHTGGFAAGDETARFLEKIQVRGVRDTSAECAEHGFSQERVAAALSELEHCGHVSLRSLRCTRVMASVPIEDPEVFALFCSYTAAGEQRTARLKGTVYSSAGNARADTTVLVHQNRRVLYTSADHRIFLEAMSRGTSGGAAAHPSGTRLTM